jgi:pyruvate dehydrogenase E2 component (dihydrolipoamide acetyltransferase)
MSVSVSMPQLGESVTEGTVTRWLKKEGERVEADEPLLEVSTDKVDTEIPSPVSGVLRGITVAEDETVAVGAELAVIDETGAEADAPAAPQAAAAPQYSDQPPAPQYAEQPPASQYGEQPPAPQYADQPPAPQYGEQPPAPQYGAQPAAAQYGEQPAAAEYGQQPAAPQGVPLAGPPADLGGQAGSRAPVPQAQPEQPPVQPAAAPADPGQAPGSWQAWTPPQRPGPASATPPAQPAPPPAPAAAAAEQAPPGPAGNGPAQLASPGMTSADGPYVTPLVRKLAAEHGVNLAALAGTGVGGRIRKQDVLDAARTVRGTAEAPPRPAQFPQPGQLPQPPAPPAAPAPPAPAQAAPAAQGAPAAPTAGPTAPTRRPVEPSALRGTTEPMSRARQLIARRMVESLQTSAQLTTVVEADVTAISRLRDRAKADFEAREGVKLSFLPFFALAAVEALKVHPRLNAIIDPNGSQVTYHDAEHLGVAVDTARGLMVPVIRNAGDLNVGGLARKIADLAQRTRAGQVSPDDLAGGTFTLTNTGSRGALFDTPIINQPQVAILGTGTVVKRAVVMEDPALGEVITVRSMVYLALTYDHRLVDGADAARFLTTVKARLEEGAFEAELGL